MKARKLSKKDSCGHVTGATIKEGGLLIIIDGQYGDEKASMDKHKNP